MLTRYYRLTADRPDSMVSDADDDGSDHYSLNQYMAACLFEVFLYGVYSALFAICIRILLRRKRATKKVFVAYAMMMFFLATVDVVLEINHLFQFVLKNTGIPEIDVHFKFLVYITSNIIADSLVIYRCYTVWNNSKRVIIIPCFLLLGGSACGYTFTAFSKEGYRFRRLLITFLFITITLNLLVTLLTAGRIWWIARKARSILGPRLTSKYNTMIAIIVKSGVIYSIYVVLDVVYPDIILDAGLVQVVGIVPTLIIVQIGLGRDAHDVDATVSMVRSDDARGFTTTLNHSYNSPPTGPPLPISPLTSPIPPSTFSTNQRTSRVS